MQLKPEQLAQHLKKGLAPIYFIYGDELLLVQEAADAIRAAARAQGYSEREVFRRLASTSRMSSLIAAAIAIARSRGLS